MIGGKPSPKLPGKKGLLFAVDAAMAVSSFPSWVLPTATGTFGIAIGPGAKSNTGSNNVAIGKDASAGYAGTGGNGNIVISGNGGNNAWFSSNTIIIGANQNAWGNNAIVIGTGNTNTTQYHGIIALGTSGNFEFHGEITFATGAFALAGDVKISQYPMWMTTTNATVTELKTGQGTVTTVPTGVIIFPNDAAYLFDVDIIARNTGDDTQCACWNLKFGIRRGTSAANTALIGTPVKTIFGQDTGTTSWDVTVVADTTNGRPNINVTGEAAKTIRWAANVTSTKVYG